MEARTGRGARVGPPAVPAAESEAAPGLALDAVRYIAGEVHVASGRIEAVRELGGTWSRGPWAPSAVELDAALAAGTRVTSGYVISLPGRAWSFAYDLGPASSQEDRRLVVVSWKAHPGRTEARLVELLVAGARSALERAESRAGAIESRLTVGADLAGRSAGALLEEVRRAVRAIASDVVSEGGVGDIARAAGMLIGRPVRVVDAAGNERAAWGEVPPGDLRSLPAPGGLSGGGSGPSFVRATSWTWLPVIHDGDVAGAVAVLDRDGSLGQLGELVIELVALVLELWSVASTDPVGDAAWWRLAEALVSGRADELQTRASRLVAPDAPPWRAALVRFRGDMPLGSIRAGLSSAGLPPLAAGAGPVVLVVVPDTVDGDAHLDRVAAEPGSRLGVGSAVPSIEDLPTSIDQARLALQLGPAGSGLVRFEELGMAALLASIGEPGRVAAFVEQRLGVLVEYDRTNRRQLVATLGAYLDHAGSIERAARALGIHPSTMKYRMGRVRELVDADLTDPDVRFELQFATRAAAVLEAAGPERSGR